MTSALDTVLDRTVVLGYGNVGYEVRKRLPGWPADPPRMEGKVVLVTGAGSGIGLATAAGFAELDASVHVVGRDDTRAEQAARQARDRAGGGDIRPEVCDVSSLSALRAFVANFASRQQRLDVLVNNAGVMPDERQHSSDGVELTFATHVLAPWVLIDGLAPLLKRAAPSRVINVSSGGQYGQRVPQGDLESGRSDYSPTKIYARTKRAEVVITEQWAERLAADDVHVHAMHPGWADTKGVRAWLPGFRMLSGPIIRNPEQGADTIVWLGGAPEAVSTTGRFWHDRRARPATHPAGAGADDGTTRQELWDHVADLGKRAETGQ